LHRISPEEIDAAYIKAVASQIREGASDEIIQYLGDVRLSM
jgi:hypothetical protein